MPLEEKHKITDDELMFGLLLLNKLWFLKFFWKADTTIPKGREDLPEEWRGTQRITKEQRLMILDESENVLFCTARKIGKCISGDSVIYDAVTGARSMVSGAGGRPSSILTLENNWKLSRTSNFFIFPNEEVQLYKVTTRAGLSIRVSSNHPFLTGSGWIECDNLEKGDMIGVARRSAMPIADTSGLSESEVALLAYLIGDGGLKRSVIFSNTSQVILDDFTLRVKSFDVNLKVKKCCGDNCDYRVSTGNNGKGQPRGHRNKLLNFLREVGLFGKGSHDKFIPAPIFRLNKGGLSLFLNRLFATDGCATGSRIGYSSMSRRLIEDLHELLLRYGIFTRIYAKKTWASTVSYRIEICEARDVIRFAKEIGIFSKEDAVNRVVEKAEKKGISKHDRMPLELVRTTITDEGISPYMAGQNAGLRFISQYQPSRDKVKRVANANGLDSLMELADSDVYWDEVASIEPDGIEQTWDVSVPETQSFVANGIITHNTLVLEASLMQHGIIYTGEAAGESLLVTPGDHHLAPIRRRLSSKIMDVPFFDMMVQSFNKAEGVLVFNTGMTWWMRVEGRRKRGESQVSLRVTYIIGDEMAFGGQIAYESRQQTKLPGGSRQLYAGVPNGVRTSPFYKLDQTSMGESWSKHKYTSYINPLFQSDKARKDLVDSHGGENTQMYITQVLGQWGKEAYSSFPRIPVVGTFPFTYIELTEEMVNVSLSDLSSLLALPVFGIDADAWIMGGDLGFSPAPTVLLIFYLKDGSWREFARIKLLRTNPLNQARIIDYINTAVLPDRLSVIALDAHQWGDAILQTLHHDPVFGLSDNYQMKAIDVGFEGRVEDPRTKLHRKCKIPLRRSERGDWYCDRCREIVYDLKDIVNARIPAKQFYTNELKDAFSFANLYLDAQEQSVGV